MTDLITLHVFAEDYSGLEAWRLAQWCKTRGATEWTVTAISVNGAESEAFARFDEAMTPFHLPNAVRRQLTASRNKDFVRSTDLWKLTSASFAMLKELLSGGPFAHNSGRHSDTWFEDLTFYRHGELMLGVISHEAEGVLRVTPEEQKLLGREGFVFRARGTYVGY